MGRPSTYASHLVCAVLVANALATGWFGLDYGSYWDEWYYFKGLANAINDVSLLPREYTYGGMYFNVGFVLLLPHVLPLVPDLLKAISANPTVPLVIENYPPLIAARSNLLNLIRQNDFLLETRAAYVACVAPATIWVYLILRRLSPGQMWGPLAGAGFMASTWEVAYHSRFIAVDAMMMQFGTLALLLTTEALFRRQALHVAAWLAAAAAVAGVAFGCKLTGMFTMAFVLTAATIQPELRGIRSRLVVGFCITLVFFLSFFLTTPGSLLDPFRFASPIFYVNRFYNTPWPGFPYYVQGPLIHARLLAVWLFAVVPSPTMVLAIPMSAVTFTGCWALWRRQRDFAWCVLIFILVFGFFLISTKIMMVRNALIFVPLTAIAFGAGVQTSSELARRFTVDWLVPLLVGGAVLYNVAWLWIAANSIRHSDPAEYAGQLLHYMGAQPERNFLVSPGVRAMLISLHLPELVCEEGKPPSSESAAGIVMLAHEHDWFKWIANRPGFVELTLSSMEVNYDYYPTWLGKNTDTRIVVLSPDHAREMNVSLEQFRRCRPPEIQGQR